MRGHRFLSAVAVGLAALAAAGCGASSSSSTGSTATSAATMTTAAPSHRIRVVYDEPKGDVAQLAQQILQVGGTDGVAAGFSHSFRLPEDLTIHAVNGNVGPNYQPDQKTITLSYGFVDYTAGILRENFPELRTNDRAFGEALAAVDGFILVHEFAHALVDVYDLPVLGREEDAADAVATVFMTQFVKGGDGYAFDAARFFHALSARQRKLAPADYWDEHSLDQQRAYAIVCWVAGSSKADYQEVEKLGVLGQDRLQRCPEEYQQKVDAFQSLLHDHLRR